LENNRGYIMKKLMITVAIAAILPASMSYSQTQFGGTAGNNTVAADDTGSSYVVSGFTMPTSTGVNVWYNQSATIMAVGASHIKGSEPDIGVGGSTEGGVIGDCNNAYTAPTPVEVDVTTTVDGASVTQTNSVGC
jgi:hypothetical protein